MFFLPLVAAAADTLTSFEATVPHANYTNLCATTTLVHQDFGNSYGHPANLSYSPPSECHDFTNVVANLHLTVGGYQYDRLMHLTFDDIELWRPSTPEPVGKNISATLEKDLSPFVNLFKTEGQISFSLDNIITSSIDGIYHVELELEFYNDSSNTEVNEVNWFYNTSSPATNFLPLIDIQQIASEPASTNIPKLSHNTTRAILNVFASGNADEEFWYTNDFTENGMTRLVEVYIGDKLAGAVDPFPTVYTGGLSPGLWQPVMSIKSSDVPSYIIDITPFLPLLWESDATNVTLAVGNGYSNSSQSTGNNWIVSMSLLSWQSSNIEGSGVFHNNTVERSGSPNVISNSSNIEELQANYSRRVVNSAKLSFYDFDTKRNYTGASVFTQISSMENQLNQSSNFESVNQLGKGTSWYSWAPSNVTFNTTNSTLSHLGKTENYYLNHNYPLNLFFAVNGSNAIQLLSVDREYSVDGKNAVGSFNDSISQNSYFSNNTFVSETNVTSGDYFRHVVAINGTLVNDSSDDSSDESSTPVTSVIISTPTPEPTTSFTNGTQNTTILASTTVNGTIQVYSTVSDYSYYTTTYTRVRESSSDGSTLTITDIVTDTICGCTASATGTATAHPYLRPTAYASIVMNGAPGTDSKAFNGQTTNASGVSGGVSEPTGTGTGSGSGSGSGSNSITKSGASAEPTAANGAHLGSESNSAGSSSNSTPTANSNNSNQGSNSGSDSHSNGSGSANPAGTTGTSAESTETGSTSNTNQGSNGTSGTNGNAGSNGSSSSNQGSGTTGSNGMVAPVNGTASHTGSTETSPTALPSLVETSTGTSVITTVSTGVDGTSTIEATATITSTRTIPVANFASRKAISLVAVVVALLI